MKHQRPTSAFGRILLIFCFLVSVEQATAQSVIGRQKVDQFEVNQWGSKNYGLTWLPNDYYSTNEKYPLIIFLHGAGENGSSVGSLWGLLSQALPQKIAQGWDPQAVNPQDGKTYKFIVVSPQAPQWSHTYNSLPYILDDIMDRYRVDKDRIYITGLSAGGAGTWSAVTNGPNFAKKFAAIVPVSAAGTNTPQEANELPLIGAVYGVKTWTICGTGDTFWGLATSFANIINKNLPDSEEKAEATGIQGAGHTPAAWNTAYDPNWRSNVHGKNIYEWMLKYKRNGNNSGHGNGGNTNKAPIAHAGGNQTITLPANSIQLQGSGSDPDGFIADYTWSKVSGPSADIVNPDNANTTVKNLHAGTYTFKLTVKDNKNATASAEVTITVNPAPAVYRSVPARIEAESYDEDRGVSTENTGDNGGGKNVGYIDEDDWMEYNINPAASGTYTINFRVATQENKAKFQVRKADGSVLATVDVPKTGGWQRYQTIPVPVYLNAGNQKLRIVSTEKDGWNFNWMEFTQMVTPPPPPPPANASLRFEAENWLKMHGVQAENTTDDGGGQNVGWMDIGDWMEYEVNAPAAGVYTLKLRIATPNNNAEMEINRNGSLVKTLAIPNTGAYQTWQTITTTVDLTAGKQTIRLASSKSGAWNINWLQFVSGNPAANSNRIEAENWKAMRGVQTENTSDEGGGKNVGWIDNADWMDYELTVPEGGNYAVKFRIATTNSNAQFLVKEANGSLLKTVNVPKTNGYQIWRTITETIYLQKGTQTVRLESSGGGAWNINWLELNSGEEESGSRFASAGAEEEVIEAKAAGISYFPNPVKDRLVLQVNNELTGNMTVQVVNMAGAVARQFSLNKAAAGTVQNHVFLGELAPGAYLIRVQLNDWNQTIKIVKN